MTTRLHVGQSAPYFRATDISGRLIDLTQYTSRPLLLSFLRTAACPLCNLRVWYLASQAARWQPAGLQVITIFDASAETIAAACQQYLVTFPLIADPKGALFRQFGVQQSLIGAGIGLLREFKAFPQLRRAHLPVVPYLGPRMWRLPADFLVAPGGSLVDVYYGRDAGDHMPTERIDSLLFQKHDASIDHSTSAS